MSTIWPASRVLLDLLTMDNTDLNRGRVQHLVRRGGGAITSTATPRLATGGDRYPSSVRQFLDDLLVSMKDGSTATTFQHPADAATHRLAYPSESNRKELTPADLAWLDRLPAAEKVSYDDAVVLATLAQHEWGIGSPSKRLVQSIWAPVNEVFDRRQAESNLKSARKPLWRIPNAVTAIADVIAHEVPALSPEEAFERAGQMVDEQLSQRRERHQQRRDDAYATVAEIEARASRRTSKTATAR